MLFGLYTVINGTYAPIGRNVNLQRRNMNNTDLITVASVKV